MLAASFAIDLCAGDAHGEDDVGKRQGQGVVGAVAGDGPNHGHDHLLQPAGDGLNHLQEHLSSHAQGRWCALR